MVKLKKRINGGTLIETIVSMAILAAIVLLFFGSMIRLRQTVNSDLNYYAYLLGANALYNNYSCSDTVIDYNSIRIVYSKRELPYPPGLIRITVRALKRDSSILFESSRIIKDIDPQSSNNINF